MKVKKTSRWWRTDLSGFRGLTVQDKAGFLPVLEWFESFRLRHGLEAGSEAVEAFWQSEVVPADRPRESLHLEQWKRAIDWYLNWLKACEEETANHERLPIRMQATVRAACSRRGMSRSTGQSYGKWILRYATFAGSEREMKREETASRFLHSVLQDEGCVYTTRKQALNAVVFFFRHVCGLKDPVLEMDLKKPPGADSSRKN